MDTDPELRQRVEKLLAGLTVKTVLQLTDKEIVVEFTDGTRLFVDSKTEIEISIT